MYKSACRIYRKEKGTASTPLQAALSRSVGYDRGTAIHSMVRGSVCASGENR